MTFSVALVLGGAFIYALATSVAGALMIAASCAIELVKFANRVTRPWWVKKA